MEAATFSEQVWICPRCGDEGFTNAFVYCVKCLDFPIHRYCLDVIPKTLDEPVIWVCEDCKTIVPNPITLLKAKSSQSQKEEAAKTTPPKKKLKKKRAIASLITGTKEVDCGEKTAKPDGDCIERAFQKKGRTKTKRNASCLGAKKTEYRLQNSVKNGTQRACTTMTAFIEHSSSDSSPTETNSKNKKGVANSLDDGQPSQPPCQAKKLISDSSSMKKESDKMTNDETDRMQTKQDVSTSKPFTDVLQSVDFENNALNNLYQYAQPLTDPVWRGSFSILHKDYDLFEGFVGHLSDKACDKVFKEASILPSLLSLEMHPKTLLWPKSFQERDPSDEHIALYFFPGDPINETAFDHLVIDMMDKGLGMRTITKNAELLIFTSTVLPRSLWRFKAKYYLWGVFKNKRNDSTPLVHHDPVVLKNGNKCRVNHSGENGVDVDRESRDLTGPSPPTST